MKTVTFIRPHKIWNSGETAGFPDTQAASLVDAGIAVFSGDRAEGDQTVTLHLDIQNSPEFQEIKAAIETAAQEIEAREAAVVAGEEAAVARDAELSLRSSELDQRAADLDQRHAEQAAFAAALDAREKALEELASGAAGAGGEGAEKTSEPDAKAKPKAGADK